MLLSRDFIGYVAREIVKRLAPKVFEANNPPVAISAIAKVVEDDLAVEDHLNDEVREILSQYSDYMRQEGISYQEMFRKIKNTLISQRKGDPLRRQGHRRPDEALPRQDQ